MRLTLTCLSGLCVSPHSRGADRAEIYSICFSPNSQLLACSSDKGTVHVFALTTEGSGTTGTFSNEHSSIAPASPAIPVPHYSNTNSGPPRSGVEDESTENSKSRYTRVSPRLALAGLPFDTNVLRFDSVSTRFSFMRGLLPTYFSSEWSFAQFRVPETRTVCAFGAEKNTIIGAKICRVLCRVFMR